MQLALRCRGDHAACEHLQTCVCHKRNIQSPGFPWRETWTPWVFGVTGPAERVTELKRPGPSRAEEGQRADGGVFHFTRAGPPETTLLLHQVHLANTLYRGWSSSSASFKCYMPVEKRVDGGGTTLTGWAWRETKRALFMENIQIVWQN